jgi:amino acid permease
MKTIYKIGLWILIIIGVIIGVLYALQLTVAFIYLWIPLIPIIIYLIYLFFKKQPKEIELKEVDLSKQKVSEPKKKTEEIIELKEKPRKTKKKD